MHALHLALLGAAAGRFPAVDGGVEVVAPDEHGTHAVVEFTGHAFVLTDRDPADVIGRGADGFGGATQPDLLRWLAGADGSIGSLDSVLVARGRGGGRLAERNDLADHPRVRRAWDHRTDVHVHGDETGLITLGTGLVGRCELSVELVDRDLRRPGDGYRLICAGLDLVTAGEPVWAQVAPGNAASLRAFLRSGFTPIGSEVLIQPERDRP